MTLQSSWPFPHGNSVAAETPAIAQRGQTGAINGIHQNLAF